MSLAVRASWFDEVRSASPSVLDVATALGLAVRHRRFGPCPACNRDEPRHPPLTVRHDLSGWMCAGCKATGDVVSLAARVLTGQPRPSGPGWDAVRAFFAIHGWCSGPRAEDWRAPPTRPLPAPPPYPDRAELRALLLACRPVATSAAARAFCARRRFGPHPPAAVLPDVYPWPRWWPFRGSPYGLVVSMVDAAGRVRSMHARHLEAAPVEAGKTRWPLDRNATGLLFADPLLARPMLRGAAPALRAVLVVEGVTDYLAAASRRPFGMAVLGAAAGGFAALGAAALPRNRPVYIATDPDPTGDRYAEDVVRACRGCGLDLRRWRPSRPAGPTP